MEAIDAAAKGLEYWGPLGFIFILFCALVIYALLYLPKIAKSFQDAQNEQSKTIVAINSDLNTIKTDFSLMKEILQQTQQINERLVMLIEQSLKYGDYHDNRTSVNDLKVLDKLEKNAERADEQFIKLDQRLSVIIEYLGKNRGKIELLAQHLKKEV